MRRSGGCLVRSRESSVLLSTCQGQAPVRFLCKVGWVGNAKVLLDVDVCVAWCHVATIKTCTADQTCRYSSRPVLESNEDHGNRPGSRDFGHNGQQIDHSGQQLIKSLPVPSILLHHVKDNDAFFHLARVTFFVGCTHLEKICVNIAIVDFR